MAEDQGSGAGALQGSGQGSASNSNSSSNSSSIRSDLNPVPGFPPPPGSPPRRGPQPATGPRAGGSEGWGVPGGGGTLNPDGCPYHRWREDFPIRWENDHYVTRRDLTKFLTLGSLLLVGANGVIAFAGYARQPHVYEPARIAAVDAVPPGGSLLFRYPTEEDPCILVRDAEGAFQAYSQVCTHLACAVIYRPAEEDLYCPCHRGIFDLREGDPVAGPPTRRLPRVRLEQRGAELWAMGVEV